MRRHLFSRTLTAITVCAISSLAAGQTAWVGEDLTNPTWATLGDNWSAGIPIAGDTIVLDTNTNAQYTVDLRNIDLAGNLTSLANENYTLTSGNSRTWGDGAGSIFNVFSGSLTLNRVNVLGTLNLDGGDLTVRGVSLGGVNDVFVDALISVQQAATLNVRGNGAIHLPGGVDLSAGADLVIDSFGDVFTFTDGTSRQRSVPLYLGALVGSGAGDGNLTIQVAGAPGVGAPYADQNVYFNAAASNYGGDIWIGRSPATPTSHPQMTAYLMVADATGTGEMTIAEGGVLRVGDAAGTDQAGSLRVLAGGSLVINQLGQPVFAGGSVLDPGANVLLQADTSYTISGSEQVLIDGVFRYGSSGAVLTVNSDTGSIGTAARGLYGTGTIVTQIEGTATVINFRGSGSNLAIDDMRVGETGLGFAVLTGGRSVNIERNMMFMSDNDYTGGTDIAGGYRLRVNSEGAAGTGDITFSGSVGSEARLVIGANGLNLGAGIVQLSEFGVLELQGDMAANLHVGGGRIIASGGVVRTLSGTVTEAADLAVSGSGALVVDTTYSLTGDRVWTIDGGGTTFAGSVLGNNQTVTATGTGLLRFDGAVSDLDLVVAGGMVVRGASGTWTGGSVALNGIYSVESDHNYAEVDLTGASGVIALGADTAQNLDFSANTTGLSLGARGHQTYSGSLTPSGADGYRLGGGGGVLTVASDLAGAANVTIAGNGEVILAGSNTTTGTFNINGYAGITSIDAFQNAAAVNVSGATQTVGTGQKPLAGLDLNNTGLALSAVNWNGGGIANSGGSLSAANLSSVFGSSNYVLGGAGDGNTLIQAGALASGWVKKVGSNTVTLESGSNAFTGAMFVYGGAVVIDDAASVGSHGGMILEGGSVYLNDDAVWNVTSTTTNPNSIRGQIAGRDGRFVIEEGRTLEIVKAHTLSNFNFDLFVGGFPASDRRGNLTFAGGGTIEHAGHGGSIWAAHGTAQLILEDSVTLHTNWNMGLAKDLLFVVRDEATLQLKGNQVNGSWNGAIGIGYFEPGTTLEATSGIVRSERGGGGQLFFTGSGSSISNTHRIGGAGDIQFMTESLSGPLGTSTAEGFPVAYIEKFGDGELRLERTQEGWTNQNQPFKPFWIVSGGLLNAAQFYAGDSGLGATAARRNEQNFYSKHLEGIIVRSGAALAWQGTQGFFDDSLWSSIFTGQDGDGWNPGEFVLEGGSTLIGGRFGGSSVSFLTLGFHHATDGTFLAYPTVGDASTGGAVEFGRSINFRSGIEVGAGVPGGLLDVTITGGTWTHGGNTLQTSVRFTNDLDGAIGVDVFQNLDVQSGQAGIYQTHANVQATTVALDAGLYFDPGAAENIAYSGTIASDGVVAVRSGDVTTGPVTGSGSLRIDSGAALRLSGDLNNLSSASSATINGTLDVDVSGIVLGGTNVFTIRDLVNSGSIVSTTAASQIDYAVGYADSGSGNTTIAYALVGDTDLDGVVDDTDLAALQANLGSSDSIWGEGDFTADGTVSLYDAYLLFRNYSPVAVTSTMTPIPEPAGLALLGLGGLALLRRRR